MNVIAAPPAETPSATAPHRKIYPRPVQGRFHRFRRIVSVGLQAILFGTPWLVWHGRQAILFDIAARRFHCFGLTFWPQEMYYVQILLVMAALTLFASTAVGGRMWCGYACPQTLLTESFVLVERWLEGRPVARKRLDAAKWAWPKLARKTAKYAVWALMSGWLGITFVGYFTPIRPMVAGLAALHLPAGSVLPILFFASAAYFDFGYFREQMCHYACPYARFQGAMFDRNTLIVGYDRSRGEPRGKARDPLAGSCVDCQLCVQVCPMGIDIRNGLQLECIACTACVDACDSVMDKLKRERGLIRYSSENALEGQKSQVVRPRVVVYGLLLVALASLFVGLMSRRDVVTFDVVQSVGDTVFIRTPDGEVANVYQVTIINKDAKAHRVRLDVAGMDGARVVSARNPVEVVEDSDLAMRVMVVHSASALAPLSHLDFVLTDEENPKSALHRAASFIGPGL